jgi:hypothetical protein
VEIMFFEFLTGLPKELAVLLLSFPVILFSYYFLYYLNVMSHDALVLLGLKPGHIRDRILYYIVWDLEPRVGARASRLIAVFFAFLALITSFLFVVAWIHIAYSVGASAIPG